MPSPRFWMMWSVPTNGSMPIHWAPSPPIWVIPVIVPTRSGSIISTMPWQPMPPPTSAPSGTLVLVLWGQPEQKNGLRAGSRSTSLRYGAEAGPDGGADGEGGARRAASMRRPRRSASGPTSASASSAPKDGDEHPAVAVALAEDRRGTGPAVEEVLQPHLDEGPLLLDDDDLVQAAGEALDDRRLERRDEAQAQQAHTVAPQVGLGRGRACAAPRRPRSRCGPTPRCPSQASASGGSTVMALRPGFSSA